MVSTHKPTSKIWDWTFKIIDLCHISSNTAFSNFAAAILKNTSIVRDAQRCQLGILQNMILYGLKMRKNLIWVPPCKAHPKIHILAAGLLRRLLVSSWFLKIALAKDKQWNQEQLQCRGHLPTSDYTIRIPGIFNFHISQLKRT